ncbi:hypothetical protein JCM14635_05550 [Megalodesulfovibrio paquesii]
MVWASLPPLVAPGGMLIVTGLGAIKQDGFKDGILGKRSKGTLPRRWLGPGFECSYAVCRGLNFVGSSHQGVPVRIIY